MMVRAGVVHDKLTFALQPRTRGAYLFERGRVPSILDVIFGPRALEVLGANFDPSLAQHVVPFPEHEVLTSSKKR